MNQELMVLIWAIINFIFLMGVHVFINSKTIKRDAILIFVWILIPIPILLFEYWVLGIEGRLFLLALFTYLLSFAWIVTYPAVYAASPTLVIIYLIDRSRKNNELINDEMLIQKIKLKQNSTERIEDAVMSNLLRKNGDVFSLSRLGYLIFFFLYFIKVIHGRNGEKSI